MTPTVDSDVETSPDQREPTAAEVQGFLDMHARLRAYLEVAGQAWVRDHGLPDHPEVRDVDLRLSPYWPEHADREIGFTYYATPDDRYYNWESHVDIPVMDLLPQFGEVAAFLRALTAGSGGVPPLTA